MDETKDLSLIEQAGADAYENGADEDANPHSPDTPEHKAWLDGWTERAAEDEED